MEREQWFDMVMWRGSVSTHLHLEEDKDEGLVDFRLGRPGFMKVFEGSWQIMPLEAKAGRPMSQVRERLAGVKGICCETFVCWRRMLALHLEPCSALEKMTWCDDFFG
jgi:hypothetical protein